MQAVSMAKAISSPCVRFTIFLYVASINFSMSPRMSDNTVVLQLEIHPTSDSQDGFNKAPIRGGAGLVPDSCGEHRQPPR